MLDLGIVHPGRRPAPLEFPFEAANRTLAAINVHSENWSECLRTHGDAVAHARVGFEGQVRQGFDQDMDDAISDVSNSLDTLDEDAEELRRLINEAEAKIEARNEEIAVWQRKMDAYDEAMDAARRASVGQ